MARLEVVSMNIPSEGARNTEFAFDECPVYQELRLFICDLTGSPSLDLLTERLEVPLNSIHADCQRVDDGEVLRMLRENRRE